MELSIITDSSQCLTRSLKYTAMKNKTFIDSLKCAFAGLLKAFKSEKNFIIYAVIAITALILNIVFKVEMFWWIGYIVTVCGVFAAELINTAIEKLADAFTSEITNEIKAVKDIAASAVLFWGFGFFAVEIIALGSKFL